MSHIYFKKITILSTRDEKGFSFDFSPNINIIFGENDTGKSSLIKSLYYTLGGDLRLDDRWKKDDIITKVVLCIGGKDIIFLRQKKMISILIPSESEAPLLVSTHMSDIAAFMSSRFDFNLQLTYKKTGKQSQANPACLYLPFYIDQDEGWHNVLSSFSGLGMYIDWQKNSLQFHAGIKPKEYYSLQGEVRMLNLELTELESTLKVVKESKKRFEESFGRVLFDVDIDYYEELLQKFLHKCRVLDKQEGLYRIKLLDLFSARNSISDEINICKNLIDNFDRSGFQIKDDIVGNYHSYENKDQISKTLPTMYDEKEKISIEIDSLRNELRQSQTLSNELSIMLSEVKGELTLRDVIKSQASKEVTLTFDEQINELHDKIGQIYVALNSLREKLSKYNDKKHSKKINDEFKSFLSEAQIKLGIGDPVVAPLIQYQKITKGKTGSRGPRAIFSYHYGLLKTMSKYSTVPMLPIVIDSPKQQNLDKAGIEKLIDLCVNSLADNNQLIIGSVSLEKNMIGYRQLQLQEKYNLLSSENYEQSYKEIMPLFEKSLAIIN